jgi:hypothetical protein
MLTIREKMALELAGTHYRYPAKREADALLLLDWTPTTFHATVNRLLDDPRALAHDPMTVRRLRRLRDRRKAARSDGFRTAELR